MDPPRVFPVLMGLYRGNVIRAAPGPAAYAVAKQPAAAESRPTEPQRPFYHREVLGAKSKAAWFGGRASCQLVVRPRVDAIVERLAAQVAAELLDHGRALAALAVDRVAGSV